VGDDEEDYISQEAINILINLYPELIHFTDDQIREMITDGTIDDFTGDEEEDDEEPEETEEEEEEEEEEDDDEGGTSSVISELGTYTPQKVKTPKEEGIDFTNAWSYITYLWTGRSGLEIVIQTSGIAASRDAEAFTNAVNYPPVTIDPLTLAIGPDRRRLYDDCMKSIKICTYCPETESAAEASNCTSAESSDSHADEYCRKYSGLIESVIPELWGIVVLT